MNDENKLSTALSELITPNNPISDLFNYMPALVFSKDAQTGEYLTCNHAFASFARKASPKDVIGLTDYDLYSKEAADSFVEHDRITLQTNGPIVFFEDVSKFSGSQRQYQTTKVKFTDSTGRLCILGLCVDVTLTAKTKTAEVVEQELERRIYLQEQLEEEEKSRSELEKMITALAADYRAVYHVDLDKDEGICYRADPNDQEQTAAGIRFPYLERFTWYATHSVAKEYRDGFLSFIDPKHIKEALKKRKVISYRFLAQRVGREYYEMIRIADARDESGDDTNIRSVSLGLSIIDKQMREALAKNTALSEALEAAQEANKAKTAFLSNMSHEIRTPMNAIIGLDSLAQRNESLPEETKEYLRKISESANHLLGLINDILDMSRIESGRMVIRKVDFSFKRFLDQINNIAMTQCEEKGLKYECRLIGAICDHYIGDDLKLRQIIINILGNAVKFTDAPGSVTLTIECTSVYDNRSTLRFSVRDTGIGMDPSFIPKVFDTFTQEGTDRKNKFGSTGLGMAITKNIVSIMNGTISVESEKGAGTEFTVILTLQNSSRQDSSAGYINPAELKVLVIDDTKVDAEHIQLELAGYGIMTDIADTSDRALKMLQIENTKLEPYNLILLDRTVSSEDGIRIADQIRRHYKKSTTVIFMTSNNRDEIQDEAIEAGVDSVLSKPLFASDIIDEFERFARKNKMSLFKEKQRASLSGKRILLAEDIMINAEIIREQLRMKGALMEHAENGKHVLEMFGEKDAGYYDAILMDVRMPLIDGLEATAIIRAMDRPDAKTIPIIAMTANAFDEDVQRSLQVGMNAHLSKPVEPERLYLTLQELIWEAQHPQKP